MSTQKNTPKSTTKLLVGEYHMSEKKNVIVIRPREHSQLLVCKVPSSDAIGIEASRSDFTLEEMAVNLKSPFFKQKGENSGITILKLTKETTNALLFALQELKKEKAF